MEQNNDLFDLIIVGGGHAGLEACWIADQFNLKIGLVTLPDIGIGSTPCNPAIGGVGKGQVVRELDAMGGIMGQLADLAGIQYRILNESKGYAVHSTRAQVDKDQYSSYAEELISNETNIEIIRDKVKTIEKDNNYFSLKLNSRKILTKKLLITTGTFLDGKTHIGREIQDGGRLDRESSDSLNNIISNVQTTPKKFKTGTPPRLDKNTLNFELMEKQPSDPLANNFHYKNRDSGRNLEQIDCYITWTNYDTHKTIEVEKENSPIFNGQISGVGPRYCPSIEDKVFRYPDRHKHHLFIEKEGHNTDSVYPNGLSTSLPKEVQHNILKTIESLKDAKILNYGYAVEYDVVDTTYLDSTLEHNENPGLYFAGQINGTSGYEEAAAQGYIAGVNACLSLLGKDKLILSRTDSYIGVLINDLVTNLREEPYRLFTARAENRLFIREDNTINRMAKYREKLNLNLDVDKYNKNYIKTFNSLYQSIENKRYSDKEINPILDKYKITIDKHGIKLAEILKMSSIDPVLFLEEEFKQLGLSVHKNITKELALAFKYAGYISKSNKLNEKVNRLENKKIDWETLSETNNISFECRNLIKSIRPMNFQELKNINGIRPATLVYVASSL